MGYVAKHNKHTQNKPHSPWWFDTSWKILPLFSRNASFVSVYLWHLLCSRVTARTRWSSWWLVETAARSSGRSAWSTTRSSGCSRSPSPSRNPCCSPEAPPSGSGNQHQALVKTGTLAEHPAKRLSGKQAKPVRPNLVMHPAGFS